jgi:hypothetical protein
MSLISVPCEPKTMSCVSHYIWLFVFVYGTHMCTWMYVRLREEMRQNITCFKICFI